ncbi:MAG: hypothetical protein KDK26_05240 [Roseivivax sp.]|nr:hypothetical protein [Roseivivax sp.]
MPRLPINSTARSAGLRVPLWGIGVAAIVAALAFVGYVVTMAETDDRPGKGTRPGTPVIQAG